MTTDELKILLEIRENQDRQSAVMDQILDQAKKQTAE